MSEVHFIVPTTTGLLEKIQLDRISAMMAPMSTSSALLFSGKLDFPRFKSAIQRSFHHCPWVVGALSGNYDNLSVVPRPVDEHTPSLSEAANANEATDLSSGFLICEYSNRLDQVYDSSTPITELLPQKVHVKMLRIDLAMANLDGVPIAALRVTQYQDHFIISYRLNHSFYDQSAIVSYFQFLAFLYNHNELPLPPFSHLPVFKPRAHLIPEGAKFETDEEFLAATPKGYATESTGPMSFGLPLAVTLVLNSHKIEELKKGTDSKISSNDVLHAILLKAIAKHASSTVEGDADASIRLFFARNMRSPLNLGHDIIGDYVRLQSIPSSAKKVIESTILELAQENRNSLSSLSGDTLRDVYSKECQWFVQYPLHRTDNFGLPHCDFIMDQNAVVVTNWTSFPYEKITLGDHHSSPVELLLEGAPYMTGTGAMVRVSFRIVNGERQLIAVLNTRYQPIVDQIQQLATESELFSLA